MSPFGFKMQGKDYRLVLGQKGISLQCGDQIITPDVGLPNPGGYDTSTSQSTYDARGTIAVTFTDVRPTNDGVEVDVVIRDFDRRHWTYGSFDDAWHEDDDIVTKKLLSIRPDGTCSLKVIK